MKNGHGAISMITITRVHNPPPIITRAMKNTDGTINIITVLGCTTHSLWLPKQDEEWTWNHQYFHSQQHANTQPTSYNYRRRMKNHTNHQHDCNHQHTRMHNSPTKSSRVGWRMDMESSTCSDSPCLNAQLTSYNCQRKMKNWHGTISMISVTKMPGTTHPLWFSKQNIEWTCND